MDFLSHNLEALEKKHVVARHLAAHLKQLSTSSYLVSPSSAGDLTLALKSVSKNIFLEDGRDPKSAVLSQLPLPAHEKNLFVLLGLGLGYGLEELLKRYPQSRFLVIEHDAAIFKKYLENFDCVEILRDRRVDLAVALDEKSLQNFLRHYFHSHDVSDFLPAITMVPHPQLERLGHDYYTRAQDILKREMDFFWEVAAGNSCFDQMKGLEEILLNMPNLGRLHSLEPYKNFYNKVTGIVVASGPSLDSKLAYLKEIQDRALIICADSALKKLLDHGITPFGVSCVERDDINARFFFGYEIPKSVILFAPPLVRHELIETYPGPIFTVFRQAFPFMWLPEILPRWYFGSSCAHLCYKVLAFLGCQNMGLIGQDLAYNRHTGSSHFTNIHHDCTDQFESATYRRLKAADNQGGEIDTNETWLTFRNIIEDFLLQDQERHCFNVIEADFGLKIRGCERIEAQDFFHPLNDQEAFVPLDLTAGKIDMQKRLGSFSQDWPQLLETTMKDFIALSESFKKIRHAKNFEDYQSLFKKAFAPLNEKSVKLFREFFKPMLRRFDANANCAWSDGEFRQRLPAVLDEMEKYLKLCVGKMAHQ